MIQVTSIASQQIQNAAQQAGAQGMALRVAAKRDFDGSIQYGMGFDEQGESDFMLEAEGVQVIVAVDSQALLKGATLDFVELSPGNMQFVFINPNDTGGSSCSSSRGGGCGSSGGGCGSGGGCS